MDPRPAAPDQLTNAGPREGFGATVRRSDSVSRASAGTRVADGVGVRPSGVASPRGRSSSLPRGCGWGVSGSPIRRKHRARPRFAVQPASGAVRMNDGPMLALKSALSPPVSMRENRTKRCSTRTSSQ